MKTIPKNLSRWFPAFKEIKASWRYLLVLFIGGIALRLAYPRFDAWWLVWLAPVPFFSILKTASPKRAFWTGWFFGFVLYYSTIFWLNTLTVFNPFVPLGILLMGIVMGLFVALFALANSFFEARISHLRWCYIPALWVVFEYFRSLGPFAFSWCYLGHTLYKQHVLIQIADITGVYGISFLIVMANVLIGESVGWVWQRKKRRHARFPYTGISVFVVLLVATLIYGHYAMHRTYSTSRGIKIGIVQPNVDQQTKLASYSHPDEEVRQRLQDTILEDFACLVLSLQGSSSGLIVTSETSITDPFFSINPPLQEFVELLSSKADTPVLFGADYVTLTPDEKNVDKMYNSAWLVRPEQGLSDTVYHKIHLVPFGEYVPLARYIPLLQESIVRIGDFDAGKESTLFRVGEKVHPFGVLICFESTMPYLARRLVHEGAEFFAVITNDAWYGDSSGPYQHFVLSVFRAIEFRRPVIRSANTGISALITPAGKVIDYLPLLEQGTFTGTIYPAQEKTLYYKFFNIIPIVFLVVLLIAAIIYFPYNSLSGFIYNSCFNVMNILPVKNKKPS